MMLSQGTQKCSHLTLPYRAASAGLPEGIEIHRCQGRMASAKAKDTLNFAWLMPYTPTQSSLKNRTEVCS